MAVAAKYIEVARSPHITDGANVPAVGINVKRSGVAENERYDREKLRLFEDVLAEPVATRLLLDDGG